MEHDAAVPSRRLGLPGAIALVMGTMIGSGVFLLPASLAPYGWNAVGAWILTISGTMMVAMMLAKMGRAMPAAGGPLAFVRHAFGPFPSFLVCFGYLASVWTAVATVAVAATSYLSSLFPVIGATPMMPGLVSSGLILAVTLLNLGGAKASGKFQLATLMIKLIPLVLVIVLAVVVLWGGRAQVLPFEPASIKFASVTSAAALTLWALVGFECASIASAKVENPAINVPRATLWGTAITGVIYLLVCSAVALLLPQDVAAASPAPFATFVERYWGAGVADLVAVFAVVSCLGAMNGMVLVQSELPRSMAVDGMLPKWFARTDLHGTSKRNLLISAALACIFVLMNSSRSMQGLFEFLLLISTSASLWLFLVCALSAIKMGISRSLAGAAAIYSLWTLWGAGIEASLMIFLLMLGGLPLWIWARREMGLRII